MALIDNCVAYYKLDGDATDEVGSNNGTISGATSDTTNKKLGTGSYSFDGVNDSISTASMPVSAYPFTVNAWVRVLSTVSVNGDPFNFSDNSTSNKYMRVQFRTSSSNTFRIVWRLGGAVIASSDSTTTGFNDNSWHMLTFVATSDTDKKLYIDGNSTPQCSLTTSSVFDSSSDKMTLGRLTASVSSNPFTGNVDEVGVWDVALSTTEISELWNSGSGFAYPFSGGGSPLPPSTNGVDPENIASIGGVDAANILEVNGIEVSL